MGPGGHNTKNMVNKECWVSGIFVLFTLWSLTWPCTPRDNECVKHTPVLDQSSVEGSLYTT